mmetsp:Transcript_20018/g.64534  ORF Transcript_20018/g.64534 Transcript_20018/m.64534 type:complete len:296 (-) Transcript_20018:28-915(-)
MLGKKAHELGFVGVVRQTRDDDAIADGMAVEHQVRARHAGELLLVHRVVRPRHWHLQRSPGNVQGETAQDATLHLVEAWHEHDEQDITQLHATAHIHELAISLHAKSDTISGCKECLSTRGPAKHCLTLAENSSELVADDSAGGAPCVVLDHGWCLHDSALELAQALDLLGLRVSLCAQTHTEADQVLLGQGWWRGLVGHCGPLLVDRFGSAALGINELRLSLRDVHIPPKLQSSCSASRETEATTSIIRLHHAQELLSAKVVLRGLLLLRRHARGWRGGIHRHCGTQSLTQIRC